MDDEDLKNVRELRVAVQWAADPRAFELLRGTRDARWAVAELLDGALAGMVGAVPLGRMGVLCHLAVRDDLRRAGLGTALTRWAVSYLRSAGVRTIRLYSTAQAESLYQTLGFRPVCRRAVYRREAGAPVPKEVPSYDRYRVGPLLAADLPELYGVDYWSYGGDRSAVIFAVLRRHPGKGLVVRDPTGSMKGYLILSPAASGAVRIGPFLAAEDGAARALLARALEVAGEAPAELIVPDPETARPLLEEFGFEGRDDRLRMELGPAPDTRGMLQYATTPYLAT